MLFSDECQNVLHCCLQARSIGTMLASFDENRALDLFPCARLTLHSLVAALLWCARRRLLGPAGASGTIIRRPSSTKSVRACGCACAWSPTLVLRVQLCATVPRASLCRGASTSLHSAGVHGKGRHRTRSAAAVATGSGRREPRAMPLLTGTATTSTAPSGSLGLLSRRVTSGEPPSHCGC
jgi:hypothetical protein